MTMDAAKGLPPVAAAAGCGETAVVHFMPPPGGFLATLVMVYVAISY